MEKVTGIDDPIIKESVQRKVCVPRYLGKGYPPEIFGTRENPVDTVDLHTLRCIVRSREGADLLLSYGFHTALVEGILLSHDEGEKSGATGDIAGPDKSNVGLANASQSRQEEQVARGRLTNMEYCFWGHFERADHFLKTGKLIPDFSVLREAFPAVMFDKGDGNEVFCLLVTNWLTSDRYDPDVSMPPDVALEFSFRQYERFKASLGKWQSDLGVVHVCNELMRKSFWRIADMWTKVPEDRIPAAIVKNLYG